LKIQKYALTCVGLTGFEHATANPWYQSRGRGELMSVALLFPGQGSQQPGAIAALPNHPEARRTLDEARRCLGPSKLHDLDSAAALATSDNAQLQLLIVAVASARTIIADASPPAFVAGHSTGAFSAAVMCGALTFAEALAVVRGRGELMVSLFATGFGMLALNRVPLRQSLSLVKENSEPNDPLYVAIINAPDQIVTAGADTALARLDAHAEGAGRRLNVEAPSHCPLMAPVTDMLATRLSSIPSRTLTATYIRNTSARAVSRGADVLDDLAESASHTVQWADAMSLLGELRVTLAIETGPGDILTRLVQRNTPGIRAESVATTRFSDITYLIRRTAADAATDGG
jgi:malonate decarboxylase epsilon subunit